MARSINMEDVKRGDLLRVWPEELAVDELKRGRYFKPAVDAVESLAASIATKGQLQPVPVTITFDKRLELAAGFTRWEALMLLNSRASGPDDRRRIECKVIDANEEEAFLANLAENRERNRTTVIDDAHNIRRLTEQFHKTDEEVRTIYGTPSKPMSPSWLEGMRGLVRLSKDDQMKIHVGELSASVGVQLAQMDPALRDTVLATAQADGGKVTTTSVLKAARKTGALNGVKALKMPEVKTAFEYLVNDGKNDKIKTLAKAFLAFQSNKLPEPDFFMALNRLLA